MSYILEALKRSEQERHQGELNHTTIDTIMMPTKRQVKHQWWPYLLIAILVINLLVYLYFQFFSASVKTQEQAELESSASHSLDAFGHGQSKMAEQANTNKFTSSANSKDVETLRVNEKPLPSHLLTTPNLPKRFETYAASQANQKSSLKSSSKQSYTEEGFEIITPKASTEAISSRALMTPQVLNDGNNYQENHLQKIPESVSELEQKTVVENNEIESFEDINHLSDLESNFQKGIPDIRFNSHIYSVNPADRRVMLNDLYLRQGQSFSGMTIETIGEFYIVLIKGSQRFKLPVLRDWFSPN